MFFKKELDFLITVLGRCGIEARLIGRSDVGSKISDSLSRLFPSLEGKEGLSSVSLRDKTMHRITDLVGRRFTCLPLVDSEDAALLIGPYLNSRGSEAANLLLGERLGVPPKNQKWLNEYMHTLPLIAEGDAAERMINAFAELMWQTTSFPIIDTAKPDLSSPSPLMAGQTEDIPEEAAINILAVEILHASHRRICFEWLVRWLKGVAVVEVVILLLG